MMIKPLRLAMVILLIVVIALLWLTTTESGLRWAYQQAKPYLPAGLMLTNLEGRLIGPITVSNVEWRHDERHVAADRLTVNWHPGMLLLATIDISQLHIQSLTIVLPETENATPASPPALHLPWRMALKNIVINDISVKQPSRHLTLKQVSLSATTRLNQITVESLNILADEFSVNLKGEVQPDRKFRHDVSIRWQATLPSGSVMAGNGRLAGNITRSHLSQQLTGAVPAKLDATIHHLLEHLSWQAALEINGFDISKLDPRWPAIGGRLVADVQGDLDTVAVSGHVAAEHPELGPFNAEFSLQRLASGSVRIDDLTLRQPENDRQIHAIGQWTPGVDGGDIAMAASWHNLRWPLDKTAWFDSAVGSVWINGNINHYDIGLATDRPWPQAPASEWYASASGDRNGMEFDGIRIMALGGETTAAGHLDWSAQLSWQAQVSATAINPASLWPQWPGQLSTTFTSRGHYKDHSIMAENKVSQLTGTLRGYPVSLNGRFDWRNNGLDISDASFHSGRSLISARGRIADTAKLDWSINAPDLAELYPGAQGQLQAEGTVEGRLDAPLVRATVNGHALGFAENRIGILEGKVDVDLARWQQLDVTVSSQDIYLEGYALQSLDITSQGQQITAHATSTAFTANIELDGHSDNKGWQGHLVKADIHSLSFDDWRLKAPARVQISTDRLDAEPFCWLGNNSAVCLTLQKDHQRWHTEMAATQLPLRLFSPWLPADMKPEGSTTINAGFDIHSARIRGNANIRLSPGTLSYPVIQGERELWTYQDGTVDITIDDQGLRTQAGITMDNGDHLRFSLMLPGMTTLPVDPGRQQLRLESKLTLHDLGIIEILFPEIQGFKGELDIDLSATGTLAQPNVRLESRLHGGSLHIPRFGLTIDQLSLSGKSLDNDIVDFSLAARSGNGELTIAGQTRLDINAGMPTTVTIKGENFEVSNTPEAKVSVSPDLRASLEHRTITLNGVIHVPQARLQPKDITMAVHVSDDAVLVNDSRTAEEKWLIHSKIRLTLGERVSFFGFGFDGRFSGKLLLEDEPGQLTRATGEIKVLEGHYRAYGQRLDVEQGNLLYTGGPLANPGLDLRAVRHVNSVTAGLKVRGTLNQPQVELFSVPAMDQTDTLSYLLLGRPLESTSGEEGQMMVKAALALGLTSGNQLARTLSDRFGLDEMRIDSSERNEQASLVIGRYLSPRLYISYGVGLIEAFNTLSVRYRISDKWQLKAESGEYQGADIVYTIER